MRNKYLENLNKIEFVVTYACTGQCKHCSEGEHSLCGERIDAQIAADAVKKVAGEYDVQTVMTFGGEPLLYADTVYAVMDTARRLNIPKRQIITNGYFSKSEEKIRHVAHRLAECGVNDLLLSVDAFHQETIPLEPVMQFAKEVKSWGVPIRLQPAWLVSVDDDNPYNIQTRRILECFDGMDIPHSEGNVVFPEGNALKYFAEYFGQSRPENPYIEDPRNICCLSFSPNGDVLDGNVYERDIMEIINGYEPIS